MELLFLGTGAGMPSMERNVTSIALQMYEERSAFWIFDCGEGTQHQILRSPLKVSRLEKIFITHLHGDHLYGLPGLLTSRSHQGGEAPLSLYGPPGIRAYVEHVLSISQAHLGFPLEIVEIKPGLVFADAQFEITCGLLEHRIDSYGYRIRESDLPGKLNAERLKQEAVEPGPHYARLKDGVDVELPDGRVLKAKDYVGDRIPGRIITILGDTRMIPASVDLARGADVLVHEATFASDQARLAKAYYHATAEQAASIAHEAEAKALIMTHISSRYQASESERLVHEARRIFPRSYLASDFWSFSIPKMRVR